MWNEYGEWSSCTKTCGGGTRFRSRSKHIEDSNGGDKCTGSERQDEDCNNDECIGILVDYIFVSKFWLQFDQKGNANFLHKFG